MPKGDGRRSQNVSVKTVKGKIIKYGCRARGIWKDLNRDLNRKSGFFVRRLQNAPCGCSAAGSINIPEEMDGEGNICHGKWES